MIGGRRTTEQELEQIEALTNESLTCSQIAERLNRSPAAIRNLRYKKHLVARAKDETEMLFQQKDELSNNVTTLQMQKTSLISELNGLRREKQNLEAAINTDKNLLKQTLAQALTNLKQQRPDLFTLTNIDQIAMLLNALFKTLR